MATVTPGLEQENAELQARIRELEELVRTDPLTGVLNLRGLTEAMSHEMARCERDGSPLCVAIIDLDDFKSFNDTKGHEAGDTLLRWCARHWARQVRDMDYLGRRGGDEFAVILPACELEKAEEVVGRLCRATPLRGASSGVALWTPSEPAAGVWDRADLEMYRNKAGREPRERGLKEAQPSQGGNDAG